MGLRYKVVDKEVPPTMRNTESAPPWGAKDTSAAKPTPSPNFSNVPLTAENRRSLLNYISEPSVMKGRKTIICHPAVDALLASWSDVLVGLERERSVFTSAVPTTDITDTKGI